MVANAMFRDFDFADPDPEDRRRIEILANGLPLFGGAQLAVNTTLVSVLHCDGSAHPRAAHVDGAVLVAARRKKDRTYPELANPRVRARLVVLAREVGGRWSEPEAHNLAEKGRTGGLLCCAAARVFAASLLGLRCGGGSDGDAPTTHVVVNDFRHAGLSA